MATIPELTDLTAVKERLGIAASDTDFDTILNLIISATTERIYKYCNRNFTKQTYVYTDTGTYDDIVILRNKPINNIFFVGSGASGVIDVTYDGSAIGSMEVIIDDYEQIFELRLVESTAVTQTVDLTAVKTIADVISEVNAFANWSAVSVQSKYDSYPARALLPHNYSTLESSDNTETYLYGAINPMGMTANSVNRSAGIYKTSMVIPVGCPYVVIYDGGYATIPDDLKDAATQISANVFQMSEEDPNLSSEKIGDYSWARAAGSFLSEILPGWYTFLASYKNPSIG